jgi:hypothetical protein
MSPALALLGAFLALFGPATDDRPAPPVIERSVRPALSVGLGVAYVKPTDLVNLVNATPGAIDQVSEFVTLAEFSGGAALPLADPWVLRIDYVYMIGSLNVQAQFGLAEYSFALHTPTLVAQYVFADEGLYNVIGGVGVGYHFGNLTISQYGTDQNYSASGPGLLASLEGNTAFGEHLFANFCILARWEFIGELETAQGQKAGAGAGGSGATLNMFGVGARLGFTYYF